MIHFSKGASLLLLVFALPLAGCGGTTLAPGKVATAQAAVRGAQEAGAEQEPQAALHLKMARDQIARAQAAADEGEGEEAARLLQRAEMDAELALAIARKADAVNQAEQAQARVGTLSQEGSSASDMR